MDEPSHAAWRTFLGDHPETRSVDLLIPDLSGIARGKRMTAAAFTSSLTSGVSFASTVYALDSTGANVDASGLVWEEGDADRTCGVDCSTLTVVPWRSGGAQVIAGLVGNDDRPLFADPRATLSAMQDRISALDLTAVAAIELEFHLLSPNMASNRRHDAAAPSVPNATGDVYGHASLDAHDEFLERLDHICQQQSLPARAAVKEYGAGQFEINLGHVDSALRAADDAFLFKRAVRAAARAVGLCASFMAKPFEHDSGNGMHVHVSLVGDDGSNVFAAGDAGQRRLQDAIGGLRDAMAESMLIFAPNANSFRRFQSRSYAPTAPTWGYNNRTVALRIPSGPVAARRIEHRVAGADANPYLVLAAVLAGMHHGLTQRIDPGPATTGNAYDANATGLPVSWERAIEALAEASILPTYLGDDLCRLYRVCRDAERRRFEEIVTPTEYAWYLAAV